VTDCYADATVQATGQYVGGLIGDADTVTRCYSRSTVTGNSSVGGLVGRNLAQTMTQCYAEGNVTGYGEYIGGLIGQLNAGTIQDCYAWGHSNGTGIRVGGLIGYNTGPSTIVNCYSTGTVSGVDRLGGMIGDTFVGGTITASYWDTEASGQAVSDGGTSKTTAEMMAQATFDPPWDFTSIWGIVEGITYPYFTDLSFVDLEIEIESSQDQVIVGDSYDYTVIVANHGPEKAFNITSSLILPGEATYVSDRPESFLGHRSP